MGLRRSDLPRRTRSLRRSAWLTLLAPSLAFACSIINAPDDVMEAPASGGTGGSAGLGQGGGLYLTPGGIACADLLTMIRANDASTSDDDVFGELGDDC